MDLFVKCNSAWLYIRICGRRGMLAFLFSIINLETIYILAFLFSIINSETIYIFDVYVTNVMCTVFGPCLMVS